MFKIIRLLATVVALLGTTVALAQSTLETDVLLLKQSWAEANYRIADKAARVAAFEALQPRAHALSEKHPQRAEPLIWEGIVYSSYAEAKGGIGALGAAKTARRLFESAIAIDAKALDGSALGSLGVLYAKVPGFPIAFGDKKKARELLQEAVAASPDGMDSNYFLGEFLADNKDVAGGIRYLEKALQAPVRPGQETADQGRREQVSALLAKLKAKG
jgi:tetratricopeptide (TPR) repeat protein